MLSGQAHIVERLELLAEKADIKVEKYPAGQVLIKKVVREKTVQIPVQLIEEILVIEYQNHTDSSAALDVPDHAAHIRLNGETIRLKNNQVLEIPVYREEAIVQKKVVVTEQVDIGKITRQHTVAHAVLLRHEELDIKEQSFEND